MACPYLSRRDRTFYVVPSDAVVRDHNVEHMSRLATPAWEDLDASEVVVLRGRDRHNELVHTWCVRLCYAIDRGNEDAAARRTQLRSTFLMPMPSAVRRALIARLRMSGAHMQSSALLTSCMAGAASGRLDPYKSGWPSVHDDPSSAQMRESVGAHGHNWPAWMRWQVRHALSAARAVESNSSLHESDADADADESDSEATEVDMDAFAEEDEEENLQPPSPLELRPSKRARVLHEARALQELLEEMVNGQNAGKEGCYLAASGHLKALVDATA